MTLKADDKKRERTTHYIMSFVGGCFAIYALAEHSNVFGSAETNNLILIVKNLMGADFFGVLIRVISLFVYASGIVFSLWLSKSHSDKQKIASMLTDVAAALIMSFIPTDISPVIALYPIAFAMSVQWCTFRSADGNAAATTFSTGNLRQLVTYIYTYITDNNSECLKNARFYLFTMLSFHIGVAFMYAADKYMADKYMNEKSILLVLVPLTAAALYELSGISVRRAEVAVTSAESDDI